MHHKAVNFYAADELAIMREERINLLYAARRGSIGRVARADLEADVSLIERELQVRAAELKRLRRLAADEVDDCPKHLRALEMEAA